MSESKFLQTLKGNISAIPPMWFMRQAGRYLPEYRELRSKAGSFLDLCFDSDLASEVTLQPIRRFDLDAAILFADILLIPMALGQKLSFAEGEGPILEPKLTLEILSGFRGRNVLETLQPVFDTVRKTRAGLSPDKALIGFAGAPWTVATYMLNGRSSPDPSALRARYYQEKSFILDLMEVLSDATVEYLIAQIDAGADAIQLFDTWASGLPLAILDDVSIGPLNDIASRVKKARPETPVILFPKGVGEKAEIYAQLPACDAVGIDHGISPHWARKALSPHAVVQGGLDPFLPIFGGIPMVEAAAVYLELFKDAPYIFNLGHGFTPKTPPENVAALVGFVRAGKW